MAAAGKMTASFVLKLEDQLSGGLNKLQAALDKIFAIAKKLKFDGLEQATAKIDKVTEATSEATTKLDKATTASGKFGKSLAIVGTESHQAAVEIQAIGRAADSTAFKLGRMTAAAGAKVAGLGQRIGVIGGAVAGYSLVEPIRAYAGYENVLRHVAITEKMEGPAVESEVSRLDALLRHDAIDAGQKSGDVAKAYSDLVLSGIPVQTVDKLIGIHSRAATAYNTAPEALGQAVYALNRNLGIDERDLGGSLAAMAYASKSGKFSVEDFSHFLPQATATFSKLGMTGRGSANTAFAALETIRQNTGDSGTAATDLGDLMSYLTSPFANRAFAHGGIDLPKLLLNAEKAGINPLDEIIAKLKQRTKGMSPIQLSETLGQLFHNQQAREAVVALLQHNGDFTALRDRLGRVDDTTLSTDFDSASRGPLVAARRFDEQLEQLHRRLGDGFMPILTAVNLGLDGMTGWLGRLDKAMPGLANRVLLVAGGMLALVAVLAAVGIVAPAVAAGFMLIVDAVALLASPVGLVVAAIAALAAIAYDIYENWADFAPFFRHMWDAVKAVFGGAVQVIAGLFDGDLTAAYQGLLKMWGGIVDYFAAEWQIVTRLFTDFTIFVDGWTGGAMSHGIANIKHEWEGLKAFFFDLWAQIRAPFDAFIGDFENSSVGRMMGLSTAPADMTGATDGRRGDESYALPRRDDSGYIEIRFANPPPGLEASSTNSRFRFQPLNPLLGPAVGVP